jgi:TP53 regulating kinase-like protein
MTALLLVPEIRPPIKGSEAIIEYLEWHGKPAVRKIRMPKRYRNHLLDLALRTKRTKEEAENLHLSKLAGVNTPEIFFADPNSCEIIMEFVQGKLLKDLDGELRQIKKVFESVGAYTARLHKRGIIHGDLTTKNIILSSEILYFLDFGLSFLSDRLEDKAEELHLLKQALKSSMDSVAAQKCFESVLAGYESEIGDSLTKSVRKQIVKIEMRGRYARVD